MNYECEAHYNDCMSDMQRQEQLKREEEQKLNCNPDPIRHQTIFTTESQIDEIERLIRSEDIDIYESICIYSPESLPSEVTE